MRAGYLYKEEYGDGPPILCLHGFGASSFSWRHLISYFSKHNKLILVDLKGFGKSAKPDDKNYSIHDHADVIYELILENNWNKLTLVGNSYGGALALLLTMRLQDQPGRLANLVLIDAGAYKEYLPGYLKLMRTGLGNLISSLVPATLAVRFVLNFSFYDKRKITRDQIESYALPFSDPGTRHALLETARQCIPRDADQLVQQYKEIKVPTLILWGRHDRIIPLKVGELLHDAIQGSVFEIFEECGHVPQEEQPEKTIEAIANFLSDNRSDLRVSELKTLTL